MFWPADETGGVPGELSRHVGGPVQPSHEMRTCRSQESGSWMATAPLCLAEGACMVGTTQLLYVPPQEAEVLPAVPPRDVGTQGPTLHPPKQQDQQEEESTAQRLKRQSTFPAVRAGDISVKNLTLELYQEGFSTTRGRTEQLFPHDFLRNWLSAPFRTIS